MRGIAEWQKSGLYCGGRFRDGKCFWRNHVHTSAPLQSLFQSRILFSFPLESPGRSQKLAKASSVRSWFLKFSSLRGDSNYLNQRSMQRNYWHNNVFPPARRVYRTRSCEMDRTEKRPARAAGALRRNVKASRACPGRKTFLVIHPSSGELARLKTPGKLRICSSRKTTQPVHPSVGALHFVPQSVCF